MSVTDVLIFKVCQLFESREVGGIAIIAALLFNETEHRVVERYIMPGGDFACMGRFSIVYIVIDCTSSSSLVP